MQHILHDWIFPQPKSGINTKQLVTQCFNNQKRQLLSKLGIEKVKHKGCDTDEPEQQVRLGGYIDLIQNWGQRSNKYPHAEQGSN